MDTRESKTREEEKEHVMGERIPADFDDPEPPQPEAHKKPSGMSRILLIAIAVPVILWLAFIIVERL